MKHQRKAFSQNAIENNLIIDFDSPYNFLG